MADAKSPEAPEEPTEATTAWHPLLVFLLERFLPAGWRLMPELLLNRLPQRVDIVVLRLLDVTPGPVTRLHSIFDHLRPHTLIEHKGPTDDLAGDDALVLLAYGAQYMRMNRLRDPGEVCLMVVCDQIPDTFVKQVERLGGSFVPSGNGLYHGALAGFALHGVQTRDAFQTAPSERLLYSFSRRFVRDHGPLPPLDQEEVSVYILLWQQVEQFRRMRGTMALKDLDKANESYAEVVAETFRKFPELLERLPAQVRIAGLEPREMLAGIDHKALLAELDHKELLAELDPRERVAGLGPDELLNALSPEMRAELARRLAH